jgi:hypothetical protein
MIIIFILNLEDIAQCTVHSSKYEVILYTYSFVFATYTLYMDFNDKVLCSLINM